MANHGGTRHLGSSTSRAAKSHARKKAATAENDARAREDARQNADPDLVAFVKRLHDEPDLFIESLLSISPLSGGAPVPFRLNPAQRIVVDAVKRQMAEGRPVRIIVLKSRRQGLTTLAQAIIYWLTSTRVHTTGLVIAHKIDSAREIFRLAKGFYSADKRHRIPGLCPEISASNERALRFGNDPKTNPHDPGLQSSMLVESAEGRDVARGLTLQALHASEVAYFDNPATMAGVGIALSNTPGSIGILESTANGFGNVFEQTWQGATAGKNDYEPIFLSWLIDPNNHAKVTPKEAASWEWYDDIERELYEKHKAILPQLKWRRQKLASPEMQRPGVTPEELFRQEYPTTPEEAFLTSGKRFFLPEYLHRLKASKKGVRDPLYKANVSPKDAVENRERRDWGGFSVAVERHDGGALSVWEEPIPGEDYVLGGDIAEGLEHGDASVAYVLRRSRMEVVARVKSNRLDPDQFGILCASVASWYNGALVGLEANGPGISANLALRRVHYSRVFCDRDITRLDGRETQFSGFRTTSGNRRSILDALEREVREMTIAIPDLSFYSEADTFAIVDGRPEALTGRHDDAIMAMAITLQMHILGGAKPIRKVAEEKPSVFFSTPVARQFAKPKKQGADEWWF